MFRAGRRLFTMGSIVLLLTAIAHTIGTLQPYPADPATRDLLGAMQGYVVEMGFGMTPTMWDVTRALSLTMSVTCFWLAVLNLLIARLDAEGRVLRAANVLSAGGVGILVALYWHHQLPPPLIFTAVAELCYLGGLVTTGRSA